MFERAAEASVKSVEKLLLYLSMEADFGDVYQLDETQRKALDDVIREVPEVRSLTSLVGYLEQMVPILKRIAEAREPVSIPAPETEVETSEVSDREPETGTGDVERDAEQSDTCLAEVSPDAAGDAPVATVEPEEVTEPVPQPPVISKRSEPDRSEGTWTARPLRLLIQEQLDLETEFEKLDSLSNAGTLLQFKALACRLRLLMAEWRAHAVKGTDIRQFYGRLVQKADEECPGHYIIPLKIHLNPHPNPTVWQEVARLYYQLRQATEVFDWLKIHRERFHPNELRGVLEGIAARQQLFYLTLMTCFTEQRDKQQVELFGELKDWSRELGLHLIGMTQSTSKDALVELASALPAAEHALQSKLAAREEADHALVDVLTLLDCPQFGLRDDDPERLCRRVRRCLDAGWASSNRELRDPLLNWVTFLEADSRLSALVAEIRREQSRRDHQAEMTEDSPLRYTPETQDMLGQVLRYTRGARMLWVGGTPIPEKRAEVADCLELAELIWEEPRFRPSVSDYATAVERADIVCVLVRFVGHWAMGIRQYSKEGKRVIILPRGLGLNRLIYDLYEQLVPVNEREDREDRLIESVK